MTNSGMDYILELHAICNQLQHGYKPDTLPPIFHLVPAEARSASPEPFATEDTLYHLHPLLPADEAYRERQRTYAINEDPLLAIDSASLLALNSDLHDAWLYTDDDYLYERIDEEGCGAFFAALRVLKPRV